MFTKEVGIALYVDDVAKEKAFWQAVGFKISDQETIQRFETFKMRTTEKSSALMTVYDKAFISQISPEVVDNQPSLIFESEELLQLHARISELTDTVSPLQTEPFPNFNFASPSGHYYAVRGVWFL